MKVFILGRNEILYDVTRSLIDDSHHHVVAVVTGPARPEYRRREEDFKNLAQSAGAEFLTTDRIDAAVMRIVSQVMADVCISINWVSVIGPELVQRFSHGILNAHFGDLPRFRGNAASNWAMILGEKEVALTVHFVEPGTLDSGDILAQERFPLTDSTTIADINRFGQAKAPGMFARVLDGLEKGALQPRPQKETGLKPFRCYPRHPRDGKIDWRSSASSIHALVRSLTKPYSGAYTSYRDEKDLLRKLYIWETRLIENSSPDVGVPGHVIRNDSASGESWVFTGRGVLGLVSVSHGTDGEDFAPGAIWKSTRMRLGMDVDEEVHRLVLEGKKPTRLSRRRIDHADVQSTVLAAKHCQQESQELLQKLLDLHQSLRGAIKHDFNRSLPLAEELTDRWERAGYLGFGQGTSIYDSSAVIGDVRVGENTWIGFNCLLDGSGGLEIGANCSIASGCQIYSHDTVHWALSGARSKYHRSGTRIGDCCYLGPYSVISAGVTVGKHTLVGALSLVKDDVPDYSIVGGVPGKVIGRVEVNDEHEVSLVYFQADPKR